MNFTFYLKSFSSLNQLCLPGILVMFLVMIMACKDKQTIQEDVVPQTMNQTKSEIKAIKEGKRTILCYGNSLTAGYGLDEEHAWPNLLQEKIDSMGYSFQVVNAGLSGETSAGGLSRIDWVLSQKVDIFILELGANDMLRGIDVKSTYSNLDSIIHKVLTKFPECSIIVAGMLSPPNMGMDYEKKFNAMYNDLAVKYEASIIPFFLEGIPGNEDLLLPDAKHPNEKGQKIVLDNVWNVLEEVINQ